ncbi:MAG TPA: bifunctional 3-(3-hydroxy-phenyl)propionate/3-hydroxycinnamic acid hydroxylase [Pseudolabrys sp.]|jgi:3-(3-hydroxy-phenyl)propionate hydroxylase|nr:bifunctional 3-(3-hydroxy-phenyl)propionate/3-hydroxycinnamic acid hydroxylase [Pseudolabrys sp.]
MTSHSPAAYDVAVVGFGPVGATLANLLSKYGLSIAVIEQAADIYDRPRAITIDHEVLRVFQACGLADVMEKSIAPHPGTHYLGVNREVIKIFDPMPPPHPLGWVPTATFVQPDVERALRDKLAQYGRVDVFLSTRAAAFDERTDGVSLTVENAAGTHTLRSRYLVACDGANSFVRKRLGIRLDDLAFDEWWIVVDAFAKDLAKRPAKCFQYCWPSRPGTYLPGPGALRRWEIKLLPGETPDDFASNDSILRVLQGFTDISDLKIWRSAVYRFHALLAQSWRMGRIFLMGDAVHQMPPFLGQGLSAGIRDAFNLAWKLAFVLSGKADEGLLETYESERKPHVGTVVATAKAFGKIIGELDPAAAKERDERLRAALRTGTAETIRQKFIPDLASGFIAASTPLAGSLFVQPRIRLAGGGVTRLDDLLGPGFVLVSYSPDLFYQLSDNSRHLWRRMGGDQIVVGIGCEPSITTTPGVRCFVETTTLLTDWLHANKAAAVVVRPDRYVYGGAEDADQLNSLISRVAGSSGLVSSNPAISRYSPC